MPQSRGFCRNTFKNWPKNRKYNNILQHPNKNLGITYPKALWRKTIFPRRSQRAIGKLKKGKLSENRRELFFYGRGAGSLFYHRRGEWSLLCFRRTECSLFCLGGANSFLFDIDEPTWGSSIIGILEEAGLLYSGSFL